MTLIDDRTEAPVEDRPEEPATATPEHPPAEAAAEAATEPAAEQPTDLLDALANREVMVGFLKGSVVGGLLVFSVCAGITLLAGGGWGPALGVGFFAACWGGPGFGGMLGAVLGFSRAFEH